MTYCSSKILLQHHADNWHILENLIQQTMNSEHMEDIQGRPIRHIGGYRLQIYRHLHVMNVTSRSDFNTQ